MQPTTLTRTLRLTGAVAYNSFRTTPVITQVSGPVSRMVVVPGQKVRQGQPMLYVASPDYSQLRTNYLKAKDAYSLAQKTYARSQDLYQHHAIAEKDLEQAESAEVQAGGDLASAEAALKVMGVTDPDALEKGPSSFEVPVRAPIGGEVVEQTGFRRTTAPARQHAMLHDFRYEHDVGAGECLSERFALRARREIRSRFRPMLIPTSFTDAFRMSRPRSIPARAPCRRASRPRIRARS